MRDQLSLFFKRTIYTNLSDMKSLNALEAWFVTGSQALYGPETLNQVAENSQEIVNRLNASGHMPVKLVYRPVVTTPDEIRKVCMDADSSPECLGLVIWMHTFSPAKMWIAGLGNLTKPFLHLHTQFNRDIPWAEIDMDFMNLNQSAHGDREFGFIGSRMRKERKVIAGHWQDPEVSSGVENWLRVAAAWHKSKQIKIARFGDNMREVAVTEGDKVEAQIKFGWSVNGYGIGELVAVLDQVTDQQINLLVKSWNRNTRCRKGWSGEVNSTTR